MKRTKNLYHFHVRKIKKSENIIKKNKLLDACLNGNGDVFQEVKKIRQHKPPVAASMDGVKEDISGHFKGIYENLYNSVNDMDEMTDLKDYVEANINHAELFEVNKVTPDVIKEAAKNLKDDKTDPVFSFSSDCIKNGTDRLFELLSLAIQSFLIHGHISLFLLLATLIPIIKDKLGSINSSKNYRSIAISSLILKIFDWVILILYGTSLGLDELQFAYQPGCSTTMCTWSVVETIDYFMRNGSNIFSCCMDMTKAFDLVKHSVLFNKLLLSGLPLIFLRLLMFIYMKQYANVKWNNSYSSMFSLSNGVRQGGVISAILYCFYGNSLFNELRRSGYGCFVNGFYHGIFGYSDDNMLLAPSEYALQKMLEICEKFANEHNLRFSTDQNPLKCKTKCIAFVKKPMQLSDMKLCGNNLPWVNSFMHLGNTITNQHCYTDKDIIVKKAVYVTKCMELNREFHFADPHTLISINQIYNGHYTGSPLWDLFGAETLRLESSYNRNIKIVFDLPYATHRHLIEPISEKRHLRTILASRFMGFIEQIRKSPKLIPKMLLHHIGNDVRSTTGRNLRNILLQTDKTSVDQLVKTDISGLQYHPTLPSDKWKEGLVKEILDLRSNKLEINGFDDDELECILENICVG